LKKAKVTKKKGKRRRGNQPKFVFHRLDTLRFEAPHAAAEAPDRHPRELSNKNRSG